MKRASLSALPARSRPEPADLTDRLLDREAAGVQPALTSPPTESVSPAPQVADSAAPAAVAPPAAPQPAKRKRAKANLPPPTPQPVESPPPAAPAEPSVEAALQQADAATQALKAAAHAAPARYELALRYRLEALAHHLQQVAEFVAGRAGR